MGWFLNPQEQEWRATLPGKEQYAVWQANSAFQAL